MMRSPKFYIFSGIILSILLIAISINIATRRVTYKGEARDVISGNMISRENSYVFASPISAKADGKSNIRITVFILDNQGLGIAGQSVKLDIPSGINTENTDTESDEFGRAIFDLSSQTPGTYKISASAIDINLPRPVEVVFR